MTTTERAMDQWAVDKAHELLGTGAGDRSPALERVAAFVAEAEERVFNAFHDARHNRLMGGSQMYNTIKRLAVENDALANAKGDAERAAQTASDAVKAAHAERDEWKARALEAEGRVEMLEADARRAVDRYTKAEEGRAIWRTDALALKTERDALRARLDQAERLIREAPKHRHAPDCICDACDRLRAFLARAAGEPAKEAPLVCHVCGKPATCVGQYEAMTEALPACDECCGHGCEDGHCDRITADEDDPAPATPTKGTK